MAFFYFMNQIVAAETIKGGKLFKGGNYMRKYGISFKTREGHMAEVWQCSCQAVVRQSSGISQAVLRKSSKCCKVVARQSNCYADVSHEV